MNPSTLLFHMGCLLLSLVLGVLAGGQRGRLKKGAGAKTYGTIALGSCLIMLVSQEAFDTCKLADVSRVAANIIPGIGTISAGLIVNKNKKVTGLTTAAGLWVTSALGMVVGTGLWMIGALGTIALFFFFIVGKSRENSRMRLELMEAKPKKASHSGKAEENPLQESLKKSVQQADDEYEQMRSEALDELFCPPDPKGNRIRILQVNNEVFAAEPKGSKSLPDMFWKLAADEHVRSIRWTRVNS